MQETLDILKQIPVEILFIVVISYYINKYFVLANKYKFLVPLALAMGCAVVMHPKLDTELWQLWFRYAGQSMVLWEVYKKFLKDKFSKKE
jgi:hypothetical protein